jgi:guanylate kinase
VLLERAELLERLHVAAEAASAGHGRLVLIGGEAGAGKTALVEAFRVTSGTARRCCAASATPTPRRARSGRCSTSRTSWAAR